MFGRAAAHAHMTVRAATSLAHRYLERKDRVGVVTFALSVGPRPRVGTQQLYRIIDSPSDGHRAELRAEGNRHLRR